MKKPKKKTKSQRTSSRRRALSMSEAQMKKNLHRKILEVMSRHTEIKCSGRGLDRDGNEYAYTEAAEVFTAYGQAMRELGLTIIPIEKNAVLGKTAYMIYVKYRLTDVDTGYSEIIAGTGLGTNGQWAANTAQTLALKQALLETFNASWPQPPEYKEIVKTEAQDVFGPAQTTEEVMEAMRKYFETKGVTNGQTSDTKNRARKKQPHKVGRKTQSKKSSRR